MKTITVDAVWRSTHTIEVDDDADIHSSNFMDWPDDVLTEIDSRSAELVDWEVY